MFGKNPIIKQQKYEKYDGTIKITQIFYTLQGEGPFAGYPANFVRFSNCNLACTFCFGATKGRRMPKVSLAYTDDTQNHDKGKRKLSEVKVGDKILTYDEQFNIVETLVTEKHSRYVDKWIRITIDGTQYFVTEEHPFMTPRGIIIAKDLIIGDDIYEVDPYAITGYKQTGNRNPMKDPEVAKRSTDNTDYVSQGLSVSESIRKKQENGTYHHTFENLSDDEFKNMQLKASQAKKGILNPNWKGGVNVNLNYLKTEIKEGRITKCSTCESGNYLEVHHIDEIQSNDDRENLFVVCKSCHTKIHKKGYNFWNGERRDGKQLVNAISNNGKRVTAIKHFDRSNFPPSIRPKQLEVHNLTCSPYNTYFLDHMWIHNCDTEFSKIQNELTVKEIIDNDDFNKECKLVVITGGEPFIQYGLVDLIYKLLEDGYTVQIETAGTVYYKELDNIIDDDNLHIICSPKTGKVNKQIDKYAKAFKYIIRTGGLSSKDGLPNMSTQSRDKEIRLARPKEANKLIYVNPCDEYDEERNKLNRETVKIIALRFGYIAGLQLHKLFDVE